MEELKGAFAMNSGIRTVIAACAALSLAAILPELAYAQAAPTNTTAEKIKEAQEVDSLPPKGKTISPDDALGQSSQEDDEISEDQGAAGGFPGAISDEAQPNNSQDPNLYPPHNGLAAIIGRFSLLEKILALVALLAVSGALIFAIVALRRNQQKDATSRDTYTIPKHRYEAVQKTGAQRSQEPIFNDSTAKQSQFGGLDEMASSLKDIRENINRGRQNENLPHTDAQRRQAFVEILDKMNDLRSIEQEVLKIASQTSDDDRFAKTEIAKLQSSITTTVLEIRSVLLTLVDHQPSVMNLALQVQEHLKIHGSSAPITVLNDLFAKFKALERQHRLLADEADRNKHELIALRARSSANYGSQIDQPRDLKVQQSAQFEAKQPIESTSFATLQNGDGEFSPHNAPTESVVKANNDVQNAATMRLQECLLQIIPSGGAAKREQILKDLDAVMPSNDYVRKTQAVALALTFDFTERLLPAPDLPFETEKHFEEIVAIVNKQLGLDIEVIGIRLGSYEPNEYEVEARQGVMSLPKKVKRFALRQGSTKAVLSRGLLA